ncbi:hypothetical protein [Bosea sp. AS-1]|uniref:hypothetical protein n=1 Tax=Bosea sp. AS-1 TaxID=2015316 RepID=UPI000B7978B5|nr:hypothetical protein [Bosea sp. AS-1]
MKISKTADIAAAWRSAAADAPLVGIIDELEALEFLGDEDQSLLRRCASVWRERPSLLPIRARACFHAAQIEDLLSALRDGTVTVDDLKSDAVRAWAILINAGNIATMLIAPRGDGDYRARADLRRALRHQARRSGEPDLACRVSRMCGGDFVALSEDGMRPARLPKIRAEHCLSAAAGEPAVYPAAMARSLQLWLATPVDLADAFDGARTLLRQVDVWRRLQGKIADSSLLDDAIRGAELLAYSRLARIGVCRALDDDDLAIKRATLDLIAPRARDPDPMRAAIEWAVDLGKTVSDPA